MDNVLVVHPRDNVGIAVKAVAAGEAVVIQGQEWFRALEDIPANHKIALADIAPNEEIIKYGEPIAVSTQPIQKGRWVHTHNLASQAWKK
jgi:altronate hydrolase